MARLFISYSRADTRFLKDFLPLVTTMFPKRYYSFFYDQDIPGGADWWQMILEEIEKADIFIYLLSDESIASSYCRAELRWALKLNKRILPVVVRPRTDLKNLPDDLKRVIQKTQWIDFQRGPDDAQAMARLSEAVQLLLDTELTPAPASRARPEPEPEPPVEDKPSLVGCLSSPVWQGIGGIVGILALILSLVVLVFSERGGEDSTPPPSTQTQIASVNSDTPTLTPSPSQTPPATLTSPPGQPATPDIVASADELDRQDTATAEAFLTQTRLAMTDTPTATATETPNYEASTEALRQQRASQTRAAMTDTPSATPTLTATLTYTPSLTATPTLSPGEAARARALAGVTTNADWAPYSEPDARGVNMVLVPAGSFTMGSTAEEIEAGFQMCQAAADNGAACQRAWFEDEGPAHTQEVAAFWIDQTEVSRAMYAECVAAGACTETPPSDFSTDPDQPINRITWFQARDYCAWRGGRLPSEAEWEYAARGPDGLIFPWGDEFIGEAANHCDGNCGEADWSGGYNYVNEENDDGYAVTAPVGAYGDYASWVGTLNQAGNVWEWTNSLYLDYPYSREQESNNADNSTDVRSLRGGSFDLTSNLLRASYRLRNGPDVVSHVIGARCVRSY
jgi:formylglycine-generating enzyme required for sulfatase activity